MAINFDKALGIHPQGMLLREKRAELLASNIANADTPGYKARDMDFQKAMMQAAKNQHGGITQTNSKHLSSTGSLPENYGYRQVNQTDTGDGNTVDVQVERNLYLENSLEYQASVQFLNSKIMGLKKAITGGQ